MERKPGTLIYTVTEINGDYASMVSEDGGEHSLTMFLLPEGTGVGSRLAFQDFTWSLLEP